MEKKSFRSLDTPFDLLIYLKMDIIYIQFAFLVYMRIIVIVIIAISWSDHNSQ